jgi:hypothetical protein
MNTGVGTFTNPKKNGVAEGEYKSRHIHRQEQNKKYDEYRRNQEAQGKKPLSRGDWAATQRKDQQGVAEQIQVSENQDYLEEK